MKIENNKLMSNILSLMIILFIWELTAIVFGNPIFPPISKIILNLAINTDKQMSLHIIYSLKRIVLGILAAFTLGLPIGILIGYFKSLDKRLTPFIYIGYPIPKMTLLPIVMLIFGLNDLNKIVMIFLITVFPVIVNIRDEVKKIPQEIYYPVYSIGATNFQILKEIVLPGIVPTILTTMKIGIGTAISVLFFTESFGTTYGMGYFIMDSYMRIKYVDMYSGIVVLSFIGLFLFIVIDLIEKKMCRWK